MASESYWNEFEDDDREEPYTVLVRPSTAGSLDDDDPTAEQSLSAFMFGPVARLFARAHGGSRGASAEFAPLMGSDQTEADSDSESDTEAAGGRRAAPRRSPAVGGYATFRTVRSASHSGDIAPPAPAKRPSKPAVPVPDSFFLEHPAPPPAPAPP